MHSVSSISSLVAVRQRISAVRWAAGLRATIARGMMTFGTGASSELLYHQTSCFQLFCCWLSFDCSINWSLITFQCIVRCFPHQYKFGEWILASSCWALAISRLALFWPLAKIGWTKRTLLPARAAQDWWLLRRHCWSISTAAQREQG